MAIQAENKLLFQGGKGPIGRIVQSALLTNIGTQGKRTLPFFAIVYAMEGQCVYRHADGRSRLLEAGDLLVVFPGVPHSYDCAPGQEWKQFYVIFDGPVFEAWRQGGVLDARRCIYHLEPVAFWRDRFLTMVSTWPVNNPFSLVPICSMQTMLAEVIESHGHSPADRKDLAWLDGVYQRIAEADSAVVFDVPALAAEMGMSYVMFRKKFTALARMSPGKYHALLVMRRACRWMHEESISSKEIAHRLGFSSEYYFSRRFKQIIGQSPRVYRQNLNRRAPVKNS